MNASFFGDDISGVFKIYFFQQKLISKKKFRKNVCNLSCRTKKMTKTKLMTKSMLQVVCRNFNEVFLTFWSEVLSKKYFSLLH